MQVQGGITKNFAAVWLAVLLCVGAFIRLHGAQGWALNPDEMLFYAIAQAPSLSDVWQYAQNETHPPLFYLLLHSWAQISSAPEFLRLLSLGFGLVLIVLFYDAGRLLGGRLAGLCCAFLATFSYGAVNESYILRNYMCFLVFLTAAFCAMLRWRRKSGMGMLLLYGLLGWLACMTHFSGLMALFCMTLAMGLYTAKEERTRRLLLWFGVNGLIAVLTLLVYRHWQPIISFYQTGEGSSFPAPLSLSLIKRAFIMPFVMVSYLLPYRAGGLFALAIYALVILLLIGSNSKKRNLQPFALLMGLGFCMLIGLYASGSYHERNFLPGGRNNLWLLPLALPFLGAAAAACLRQAKPVIISLLFIGLSVICYSPDARFADGEYMAKQSDYARLQNYLHTLGHEDVIITDRLTGFYLRQAEFNPYSAMLGGVWENGAHVKGISYGKAIQVFDAYDLRFMSVAQITAAYNAAEVRDVTAKAGHLIFVHLGNPSWQSEGIAQLRRCNALTKTVATFPGSGGEEKYRLEAISVTRGDWEKAIAQHSCEKASKTAQ